MSRTTINCPHCGKATSLDMTRDMSTQKCDRCGIRVSSVDTGLASSKEIQPVEPPSWRRAKIGDWDDEQDPAAPAPAPEKLSPKAWIAAAAAFVAIGAIFAWYAASDAGQKGQPPPVAAEDPADAGATGTYQVLKDRITYCVEVAEKFLKAQNAEDVLPLILHRGQLEPVVREYYTNGEGKDALPLADFALAPIDQQMYVESLKCVVVHYQTPGQLPRAVALKETGIEGEWRIDWPSAVGLNEIPLHTFLDKRDTTPRLCRLLAVLDDYYNRDFADERGLICIKFTDTAQKLAFYGYAPRDSAQAQALLASKLPIKFNGVPVIVRLKFPEKSTQPDQVEILEYLGAGWILDSEKETALTAKSPAAQ